MNLVWNNCYDDAWLGFLEPASMAHPAKFARGLIERIYAYLFEREFIKHDDVIVDPFGGVGGSAIIASYLDLQWVGCELEPKFHALAERNFALHAGKIDRLGLHHPRIVCGDSRKLRENLAGVLAECCVSSPPYASGVVHDGNGIDPTKLTGNAAGKSSQAFAQGYGSAAGQLGSMPAGDVAAVLSSPPYAESSVTGESNFLGAGGGVMVPASSCERGYGSTSGNLGNLPAGAVVTSPPFENQEPSHAQGSKFEEEHRRLHPTKLAKDRPGMFQHEYGDSEGQIGTQTGETFWSAARLIVQESFTILRPGAVAVFVCKDYIRKGRRVAFSDDWQRLCESAGFVLVERIRASLVKDDAAPSLFGGMDVRTTKRCSFFRRLYEKRHPENAINWEDIVVVRKPDGNGGGLGAVVSSPPYVGIDVNTEQGQSNPNRDGGRLQGAANDGYGTTPGQLGAMKPGKQE